MDNLFTDYEKAQLLTKWGMVSVESSVWYPAGGNGGFDSPAYIWVKRLEDVVSLPKNLTISTWKTSYSLDAVFRKTLKKKLIKLLNDV